MKKIIALLIASAALGSYGCSADTGTDEATGATEEALSQTTRLRCESNDHRYQTCDAGGRIDSARVVRQLSSAGCEEGRSWGYARDYVWVNNGCRAEFELRVQRGSQPGRIQIVDATYGANGQGQHGNATDHMARQCEGRSTCDYTIQANAYSGTSWGGRKDFDVRYNCGDGSRPRYEYVEAEANGRRVYLSCSNTPPPPPPPHPGACGILEGGDSVYPGEAVRSCNGRAQFVHQEDGNIVLYNNGRVLAQSNVRDWNTSTLTMQDDGNLVQYSNSGRVLWSSNTPGNYGARLAVQDDCNVVIYDRNNRAIWHTNTAGCVPEH